MPSRFSPVTMASCSATSATMAWGMMPSSAMGKAEIATIKMPGTMPLKPGRMPMRAVTT